MLSNIFTITFTEIGLLNFKILDGQLARILTFSSAYDFSIQHRAGRLHSNCDALSRRPCVEMNCKYCERVENKFASEQEGRSSQESVSVHRIKQTYSSLKSTSQILLVHIVQVVICLLSVVKTHVPIILSSLENWIVRGVQWMKLNLVITEQDRGKKVPLDKESSLDSKTGTPRNGKRKRKRKRIRSSRVENEDSSKSYHICGKVDKKGEVQDLEPKPGSSRDDI